jgi:hypothetical protein
MIFERAHSQYFFTFPPPNENRQNYINRKNGKNSVAIRLVHKKKIYIYMYLLMKGLLMNTQSIGINGS